MELTAARIFVFVFIFKNGVEAYFERPDIFVEALSPYGFRVSIPDQPGIKLFAFHGKINKEFEGREGGTFSRDVNSPTNGRWTFVDKNTLVKVGDVIHYWINVDHDDGDGVQTYQYDGSYLVREYVEDESVEDGFRIPEILIEPLTPRGLRASIPDIPGMKLFSFHVNVNKPMDGKEAGDYSKDVNKKGGNNRWTFLDRSIKLKKGDKLHFWYYVLHSEDNSRIPKGYERENLSYTVVDLIFDDPKLTTARPTTTKKTTKPVTIKTTTLKPGCEPTETKINGGKTTCEGKLLLHENFANIAPKRWETEIRFGGEPDYEYTMYLDNPEVIYTSKNLLHIRPKLTDALFGEGYTIAPNEVDLGINCTGDAGTIDCVQKPAGFISLPPVVSGKINTKPSLSFKYGIVEVRAKLPKGDWIYPEISLTPKEYEYGPHLDSGKIRIAFVPGNRDMNKKLFGGIVLGQSREARNYGIKSVVHDNDWSDDFHMFSIKWKPDGISVFVDGELFGNIVAPSDGFAGLGTVFDLKAAKRWKEGSPLAPFDQEMVLNVGAAAGGHIFEDQETGKPWKNEDPKGQRRFYNARVNWTKTWNDESIMQVDYVKVWAL